MTEPAQPFAVMAHTLKIHCNLWRKCAIRAQLAAPYCGENPSLDTQWVENITQNSQATGFDFEPMDYGGSTSSQNVYAFHDQY
jgi:hypothetical protein